MIRTQCMLSSATLGEVFFVFDNLVILAVVHVSRLHLKDDFAPAQRANTLYESLGMVVSAKKCGSAFEHEVWGRPVGRKSGKAVFRLGTSSVVDACHRDETARGLSGHDFRRLLGLWVYALSFRREALSVLDVAFVAAECFPPRRRCAVEGAFVTAFPAPLLDADLRAQPHLQLFATDASPSGAGAWSTPVSLELWTRLHDFSDEKGLEHEFDAHTGTSRLTSSGGRIGGGFTMG